MEAGEVEADPDLPAVPMPMKVEEGAPTPGSPSNTDEHLLDFTPAERDMEVDYGSADEGLLTEGSPSPSITSLISSSSWTITHTFIFSSSLSPHSFH